MRVEQLSLSSNKQTEYQERGPIGPLFFYAEILYNDLLSLEATALRK